MVRNSRVAGQKLPTQKKEANFGAILAETLSCFFDQVETGTPYMLYKDACNSKSNQQNLGCIKVNTHMRPPL